MTDARRPMSDDARRQLLDEWTRRGADIARFVTENVPRDYVPICVVDPGRGDRR